MKAGMRRQELILYHFPSCPYCRLVQRALDELGLEIEQRDIRAEPVHADELRQARGRTTVPVLRIIAEDGSERWMPESADIVRYLQERFG